MAKVLDFHGREVLESGRAEGDWGDAGTYANGHDLYMIFARNSNVEHWYRAHMDDPETPQPFKDGMDAAREELAARGGLRLVD